jgi:MoCo/4Fe-4S cofactor protein with predicted Tat translocation signal
VQNVITKKISFSPMGNNKKYWKGLEQLENRPEFLESANKEFQHELPIDAFLGDESKLKESSTGRRDFLKFLGFSVTAAALASCETPVIHAIPYLNKPEEVTPGVANWYASTYYDGNDYGSILVKTREGRPIHIKGNKSFGINHGAINARINSSVLSLYDAARLQSPLIGGNSASWREVDSSLINELKSIAAKGGKIRLMSNTIISPSTKKAIAQFAENYEGADFKHVTYDSISYSGITRANKNHFNKSVIPNYDFSKANVIVSVAADFLGSWLMSTQYVAQYIQNRKPEAGKMSRHIQFESLLSVTGANADDRFMVNPSKEGLVVAEIYNNLAKKAGKQTIKTESSGLNVSSVADELWANKGKSLVVAGSNDENIQTIVNEINLILGNYGKTIDVQNHATIKQGCDKSVAELIKEMNTGKVDALLLYGVNPCYSLPNASEFTSGLEKVKTSVSFSLYQDETASHCKYVCPDNHQLESWNDFSPVVGHYAISQPTISKLFDTRQAQDSLLRWADNKASYYDFIREVWRNELFDKQSDYLTFDEFWNYSVHNGSVGLSSESVEIEYNSSVDLNAAASMINKLSSSSGGFELTLYQKAGIGDGSHVNNPWLQEMPDPISKVTWDNYITMSPSDVKELGLNDYIGEQSPASVVKISVNGKEMELPVYPSPGQKPGTIGIAVGYGRGSKGEVIGKSAFQVDEFGDFITDSEGNLTPVGKNVFPLASMVGDSVSYYASGVNIEKTGSTYPIATTQTHHTVMGRTSVVRETSLDVYKSGNKDAFNPDHTLPVHENGETVNKHVKKITLWEEHPVENIGHRWGMTIDLNTCIGCSACVTACQSENNVPVVGKDEVRRARDMHWMRIDRYYSSEEDKKKIAGEDFSYAAMEVADENPNVVFMPVMCQHCNHAPCETVCPVAATTHSNEGLNQMTYNRCIGTRYCANNCPYKVRRFNWFNYVGYKKFKEFNPAQDDLGRMVLNPDVTVRSRGVMEKCSFCVQSIQAAKLEAKKEGRKLKDGEVQTACSSGCPTNAIQFGDVNDKETTVAKISESDRSYHMLEEIGVRPNVFYMVKVRNESEKSAQEA